MDQDVAVTVSAKDEASKKLQDVSKSMEGVGDVGESVREKLQKASLAVAAIGAGLTAYSKSAVDSTVDYVKSVNTLSRQTGMAVDTTSKLVYAFQRSGISADQASASLGIFSKQIVAANEGAKEAALKQADLKNKIEVTKAKIAELTAEVAKNGDKTGDLGRQITGLNIQLQGYSNSLSEATSPLEKLGVATKNAAGEARPFNDILLDVADRFKDMPNGAEKTALSMELFGRSGKDLIPILNKGRDGIEELGAAADKLGLTLTTKNVTAVAAYTKANKDLKDSQQALSLAVGTEALPMWQKLSEATNAAVSSVLKLPEPFHSAAVSVLAFGGPVATALAGVMGFGANLGQVSSSFPVVGKALGALGGSFGSLGSMLIGWPGIILAVVVGLALLLQHFGMLKPMVDFVVMAAQQLWNVLQVMLAPAIQMMQNAIAQLQPYLPALMEALKIVAYVVGGILVVALVSLIATFVAVVNVVAWVVAAIVQYFSNFLQMVGSILNVFKAIFSGNFAALPGLAWDAVQKIIQFFYPINIIGNIVSGAMNGARAALTAGANAMVNIIRGFVGIFTDSGRALIDAFTNGVSSAFGKVKDVVKGGLDAVRKLLPFSDAKEGPLSTLTLSGRRFATTFAAGIDQGAPAMAKAAEDALSGMNINAVSPVDPRLGNNNPGNSSTVNNQFYGNFNMADQQTVDYFFGRLDRDAERAAQGAPV